MRKFLSSPLRVALLVIGLLILFHAFLTFGRHFLPGFAGELCGRLQGLSVTPFVMEISLVCFGFLSVMIINNVRRKWDGEEFVSLEISDDPESQPTDISKSEQVADRAEQESAPHDSV